MNFKTAVPLITGIIGFILTIIRIFEGNSEIAFCACTSVWAFATFFSELNLSKKEKQIQRIKDAVISSNDEVEAINKISEII